MDENTINDKCGIGAKSVSEVFTWIYAACCVHVNIKIHTYGAISMGCGIIHRKEPKQKINVNSLTEAELVGVVEYIPYNPWLMIFPKEQEYSKRKIRLPKRMKV